MWICKYFFMYVIFCTYLIFWILVQVIEYLGGFFFSSFLQIVSFVQELWVLCVGCLWWRLLPILLGFCSWMSIGWTVYFHLNFTHPCSFVILKYFGVGEYVPVYPFKGSVKKKFNFFNFFLERLGLLSLNLGKPSLGFGRPMATMFKVSLVGLTPTTIYKFISHVKHCSWLWEAYLSSPGREWPYRSTLSHVITRKVIGIPHINLLYDREECVCIGVVRVSSFQC